MLDFILEALSQFMNWLLDGLIWLAEKLAELFLAALSALVNAIPAPGFYADLGNFAAQVPASVWWMADVMAFGYGVTTVMGAYAIRFLIRRIPFIG